MPMRMSRKASVLWKSMLTGAKRQWGRTLSKEIKARLWAEMSAYIRVGACDYLVLVRDMCRAARHQGFVVGAGRGAAVGSAVCSALGITGIDPIRHGLLFERFLCGRKNEFPDIDFEFDREGRDWVRDWLVRRFGADRVAHIMYHLPEPSSKTGLSVHPSAVAISDVPHDRLFTVRSVDGPRLGSRHRVLNLLHADRREAEAAGLLLVDLLPHEGLTRIRRTLARIRRSGRRVPNMDKLPLDDEPTLRLFRKGHTAGISLFDSADTRKALRRVAPQTFDDLVVFLATKGSVVKNVDEVCRAYCEDTDGTLVFQEQLDAAISDLAGVTLKEAELICRRLRRGHPCAALSNVKEREHLEALAKTDLPMKSHAVSRAYLGYQQAYLKAHYPSYWKSTIRSERSVAE